MGWLDSAWGGIKKAANYVSNAGSDFIDHYYNEPADAQKKGLQDMADRWRAFGQQQGNFYSGQNQQIQDYYGQTGRDIDTLRNQNPQGALQELWNEAMYGGDKSSRLGLAYNNVRPGQQQDFYAKLRDDPTARSTQQQDYYSYLNGNRDSLTNQEDLYNARKGGFDPAANYEDQRAVEGINRQLAARGGYSNTSRGGIGQINDYYANVGAQRSHQLADLAAGADSSRLGKNQQLGGAASGASSEQSDYYKQLGNAASGASKEEADWNAYKASLGKELGDATEKHLNDVIGADQHLAQAKADIQEKLAEKQGQALSDSERDAMAAELAKLGVDPQKIKDLLGLFGGVVKTGAQVASA